MSLQLTLTLLIQDKRFFLLWIKDFVTELKRYEVKKKSEEKQNKTAQLGSKRSHDSSETESSQDAKKRKCDADDKHTDTSEER